MPDQLLLPSFWAALFSVTLIQLALGADNLIIITIIANKLPGAERAKAIRVGLILAMLFRIALLAMVSWVLTYATAVFWSFDGGPIPGVTVTGELNGKAVVLTVGGLFLIWKGVHELRVKLKGIEHGLGAKHSFRDVVAVIVGMNLLFSVDSILTVVGMTDIFLVMVGQPRVRDPRALRPAPHRLRADPRGGTHGQHDGQRHGIPLHTPVDRHLHAAADVRRRPLPELVVQGASQGDRSGAPASPHRQEGCRGGGGLRRRCEGSSPLRLGTVRGPDGTSAAGRR
jgi:hypothetical protein